MGAHGSYQISRGHRRGAGAGARLIPWRAARQELRQDGGESSERLEGDMRKLFLLATFATAAGALTREQSSKWLSQTMFRHAGTLGSSPRAGLFRPSTSVLPQVRPAWHRASALPEVRTIRCRKSSILDLR